MDIDLGILNDIFSKITDIKNNLTSTDTNKPLSAKQGKVLNETKISHEDYLYIDTVDATVTYEDDSTDTIPFLADIRNVDGIMKVAIKWDDNNNENNTRPSSVAVMLERNNEQFQTYTLNSENNWQKKVTVPMDDGQGNTYSYSWVVSSVIGYITNDVVQDGNLLITTLRVFKGNQPS